MEFFQRVPKDLHENLRFRLWLYKRAAADVGLQRAIKEACHQDILFWTNAFLWTYDPRLRQKKIPFITYPFQDEGLLTIQAGVRDGFNVLVKKSRDMGASWQLLVVFDHFGTFERDCTFFMMSRNQKMVDNARDSFSLFWKIDEIHRMLPSWLRPRIETGTNGKRKSLEIHYLDTGSIILGGATVKAAAVGGRTTAIGVDEFSRFEVTQASLVKSGLDDVTNCIVWPFTRSPLGAHHPSNELIEQANKGEIRCLDQHWRKHPVKARGLYHVDRTTRKVTIVDKEYDFPADYKWQLDGRFEWHSPWFDKYRLKKGNDREVSENLEFDDTMSGHLVFDPVRIAEYTAAHARPADFEGDLTYDEETGTPGEFFEKRGGPIRLWMPLDTYGKPPKVEYVAGCDISLGVGKTNSCMSAGRCDISQKVLEFVSCRMKPEAFATKCVAICKWLNSHLYQTLLGWERQGPGETFGNHVQSLGYYPVYYHTVPKLVGGPTSIPGFPPRSMATLLTGYETALYSGQFLNPSKEALDETLDWVNTPMGPKHKANQNRNNDPSGATLNHGDRCVSDALCERMMRQRGASVAQAKEAIQPGSLAFHMRQADLQNAKSKSLFPNWNKKII